MTAPEEWTSDAGPLVLDLLDAAPSQVDELGRAPAELAELGRIGMPVPAGFVITTRAARALSRGAAPDGLWPEVARALDGIEQRSGLRLGDPARPLLLSVTAPAPGPAVTVEGIGMTDAVLAGLDEQGAGRFARATHATLLRSYARNVLGLAPEHFDDDSRAEPRTLLRDLAGEDLPQDALTQLRRAVDALVLSSRNRRRDAREAGLPEPPPPALLVVQVVSGDRGPRSGSGVASTRDPVTGAAGLVGDYLPEAAASELAHAGLVPVPLSQLRLLEPEAHAELVRLAGRLESHRRDLREVDFVIEQGRLWIVRDRAGRRSAQAAFRIATDLVDEGLIDLDEALSRVEGARLQTLLTPVFRPAPLLGATVRAVGASPGSAIGELVLDSTTALLWSAQGRSVVLALDHPHPDDTAGIRVSHAVLTSRGGRLIEPASVARELGVPCVTHVGGMSIDSVARILILPDGLRIEEGALLSVDGTTGRISKGSRESQPSPVARALQASPGGPPPRDPTTRSVVRLLDHADSRRRLEVHANAETPEEARIARRLGAQGIGLCRTENLLLGPRRELMERLLTGEKREGALEEIEAFTYTEFSSILEAMDGLPVVVRLLDPPLHEFLPDLVDLSVETALAQERGEVDERQIQRLLAVRLLRETNPLLGLRGVRILTVLPQIADVQVRALARATVSLRARGLHPAPEIMIPLVADVAELDVARSRIERIIDEVARAHSVSLDLPVGVMIELPRAALTAWALAASADFFSFGTNDLTQTCWGISRDDAEASFLRAYREAGILTWDPFVTIDECGVGRLVNLAAQEGRAAKPKLRMGACGRHAEDPGSVGFFARVGLDYLSCSALRIPVIRLEAGRQAVANRPGHRPPLEPTTSSDEGE
jgi:pyruvate,orthophosphate dikinase